MNGIGSNHCNKQQRRSYDCGPINYKDTNIMKSKEIKEIKYNLPEFK